MAADPITFAADKLTQNQIDILADCLEKKSGGLSLPMGSGKTLLSLMIGLHLSDKNPILVVVSKTLISSWVCEIEKFFKDTLPYQIFHNEHVKTNNFVLLDNTKVILTTPQYISKAFTQYDIAQKFEFRVREQEFAPEIKYYNIPNNPYLRSLRGNALLYSIEWDVLIIDEAQCYTNVDKVICKSIASVCAKNRWLLSGTLFEEPKPERIFGFYLLLNPPNIPRNLPEIKNMITDTNFQGLKQHLIWRNKNDDYTPPEIKTHIITHNLTPPEAKIYLAMKQVLKTLQAQLNEYKRTHNVELTKRFSSYLLAMLTYLRQGLVCPLVPIASVAIDVTDFECKSELSETLMDEINKLELTEWFNNPESVYSSRIKNIIKQLDKHKEETVVVFSCYRTNLLILEEYIKNRPIYNVTGTMSINKRNSTLDEWKESTNGVLLLTYQVGANGLNLQHCKTAMLIDYWWNASKTKQAIARIIRFGQTAKLINVYYFSSNTSLENAIFKRQHSKLTIAEELFSGKQTTVMSSLKMQDILRLITVEENQDYIKNIYG